MWTYQSKNNNLFLIPNSFITESELMNLSLTVIVKILKLN